jgi:tetratricopeptide (TPR) repeat protein
MAAEAARRAGDWRLAARLYRESGDLFQAAEMTYRDGQFDEAAELYLQARAEPAAAQVLEQIGKWPEASAAWDRAGDTAAAVRALESGGLRPSADLLQRAGRIEEAVMAWVAESRLDRAAAILEHDLRDLSRAAQAYLHIGQARHAGELFEQLGRREHAIAAYRRDPAARMEAIRLCLDVGDDAQADAVARELSSKEIGDLEDEQALLVLARLHQQKGRTNEAIALLQRARTIGGCGGGARLMLGRLLMSRGLTDLAETELRAAAEQPLDPAEQMEAAYLLGRVLEDLGRASEAAEVFRELAQKDLAYRDVEERYRRLRAAPPPPPSGPPPTLADL